MNEQENGRAESMAGKATAILLIAHGSRQESANQDLVELVKRIMARGDYPIVEGCFLELAQPDLPSGGYRCVTRGAGRVLMVPYFLSAGVHIERDLTAARDELQARHAGTEFHLGPPLGPDPLLDELVARRIHELDERTSGLSGRESLAPRVVMKLLGKTVLVTGAARGIGRGCAIELARAGADVVVNDRERTPEGLEVVAEIEALGRRAALVEGDVFERPSCERVVERALDAIECIDILISNPAFQRREEFLKYDPDTFTKVINGTLIGGFHMSQLVARHMVERGEGGKIVFISSCHVHTPYARSVAYNSAKGGLNLMAMTIAGELTPHRINVNVIEPGWIDTPGEHEAFSEEALAQAGAALPWGRLGRAEDIGKTVAFLASSDADYITGAILRVDGGIWLQHARE
jgi:glucose 1-dehydrogenase